MFKKNRLLPTLLTIVILLAGATGFYGMSQYFGSYKVTQASTLAKPQSAQASAQTGPKTLKQIVQENQKRVVQILVQSKDQTVLGSGFLYDGKGDVITNAHVVKGAKMVTVKTNDSKNYTGKVIGVGNAVDVALVRVNGLSGKTPVTMGNQHPAKVGDKVIALGSPLGLQNTVTTGMVSGIHKDFQIGNFSYQNVYQISAPITHGNSGGPLLSRSTGKVLAINSAGTKDGNIGFSIPVQEVLGVVREWAKHPQNIQGKDARVTDAGAINGDVSTKDAMDLISFYYQSINAGDYVTAYAQLGSDWQNKISYEKFRDGFINTISSTVTQMNAKQKGKNVIVTADLNAVMHKDKKEQTAKYKMTFTIGTENNQLKLLKGSGEKIKAKQ